MSAPRPTPPRRRAEPAPRLASAAHERGLQLSLKAAERLVAYRDAMLAENQHVNLTAVREPDDALWLHALDSVLGLLLAPPEARQIFDLGTGNGFPGVAFVVGATESKPRVVLCDRTRKKVDAIQRALQACHLRAETLWLDVAQAERRTPEHLGCYDLVTARAVAEPAAVARLARPLLAPGGSLLLWLSETTTVPERLAGDLHLAETRGYELPTADRRAARIARWEQQRS